MEAHNNERAGTPQSREMLDATTVLEDKGLVANLTDCLSFSPAFTLTGFETMNDKVLKEMNDRAKHQLGNRSQRQPRPIKLESRVTHAKESRPRLPSKMPAQTERPEQPLLEFQARNTYASTTGPQTLSSQQQNRHSAFRAPDITRRPIPVPASPPKRGTVGHESPSKRLRAPSGAPANAPASPTSSLSKLNLNEKERLTQVSAARQQSRRENASPRRRQLHKGTEPSNRAQVSLNARPLPSLKLEQGTGAGQVREPAGKHMSLHTRPQRKLGDKPNLAAASPRVSRCVSQRIEPTKPSIQRSTSMRSVSATATSGARAPSSAELDSLPSYARPTKAALRRSQSTAPHQQHALSQNLRPSSSTRSVSRLLN